MWQKLHWMKHLQSTYLRASCLGPTSRRHTPIYCDQQKRKRQACCIHEFTENNGLNNVWERKVHKRENQKQQVMDKLFKSSAISCITCTCIKWKFQSNGSNNRLSILLLWELYFLKFCWIIFFARIIEESTRFAKQNPFQSYKALFLKLSGELLDQVYKSTEQLVAPI